MTEFFIRMAMKQDALAISEIYNDAVLHTTAIWNDETVSVANRADWIETKLDAGYPLLVAQSGKGEVVGYASYGPWRAWDGYRHTVEHLVYVEKSHRGHGLGRLLLEAIILEARTSNIHVMVAGIEAQNTASIKLHEKLGFEQAGTLREVGTKFGRWLDLTFMELRLEHGEPISKVQNIM